MFPRDIDRMFREMERSFFHPIEAAGTTRLAEGKRVEVVNGERREYTLDEDGEWQRVDDPSGAWEFDGDSLTIDLSGEISSDKVVGEARINNGVLSVDFSADEE